MLLQVIRNALVAVGMPLLAQLRKKISILPIFIDSHRMELSNILIIKEVFLVLVSKWNFLHEEVHRIIFLQLLDLLDTKAFNKILGTKFIRSKQYLDRRRCNLSEKGQKLLMVFLDQVINVVQREQELPVESRNLQF